MKTVDNSFIYVATGVHDIKKVLEDWRKHDVELLPSIRSIKIYPGYDEKDYFKYTSDIAVLTLKDSLRNKLKIFLDLYKHLLCFVKGNQFISVSNRNISLVFHKASLERYSQFV